MCENRGEPPGEKNLDVEHWVNNTDSCLLSHSPISPVYATYQSFSESDFSGRVFHVQISGLIFFVSFGFLSAFIEPKD